MCVHAEPGRRPGACTIYDVRPDECRTFRCAWLISNEDADKKPLPIELRPDRSHVVFGPLIVDGEPYDNGTVAHVDPEFPDAWREAPVLGFIDRLMGVGVAVVVCCDSKFAILKRSTAA